MNCRRLPVGFETSFVEHGKARPDATPQQRFVVHPTVGSRAKYSYGFQQVTFTAAIGTDENVDKTEINLDFFEGFEGFDFDLVQHNVR